jgi:DNA-directed RNA polymerase specialized sigma24 family protein
VALQLADYEAICLIGVPDDRIAQAKRLARALYLRYEQHWLLKQIADDMQISTERVRQLIAKGVRHLRHPTRVGATAALPPGLRKLILC